MTGEPIDVASSADAQAVTMDGAGAAAGLTPLALQYLGQTRPWLRFMAIVAFVMAGFMVALGLLIPVVALIAQGVKAGRAGAMPLVLAVLLALLYAAMSLVYAVPGVYLFRYAKAIGLVVSTGSAQHAEDAFRHQRSFWRFVGICTIAGVVLGVLGFVVAIVVGAAGAMAAMRG